MAKSAVLENKTQQVKTLRAEKKALKDVLRDLKVDAKNANKAVTAQERAIAKIDKAIEKLTPAKKAA